MRSVFYTLLSLCAIGCSKPAANFGALSSGKLCASTQNIEMTYPTGIEFQNGEIECFQKSDTLNIFAQNGTYSMSITLVTNNLSTDSSYYLSGKNGSISIVNQFGNTIGTLGWCSIIFSSLRGGKLAGYFTGVLTDLENATAEQQLSGYFNSIEVIQKY